MVRDKNYSLVVCATLIVLFFVLTTQSCAEVKIQPEISVIIDGKRIIGDIPLIKVQEKLYVNEEFISKHLGAQIVWLASGKSVRISRGDKSIIIWIEEKKVDVSGELKDLTDPLFLYRGTVYFPLRFIALSLGAKVVEEKNKIEIVLEEILTKEKSSTDIIAIKKEIKQVSGEKKNFIHKICETFKRKLKFVFYDEIVNNRSNRIMAPLAISLWIISIIAMIIKWNTSCRNIYLFLLFPVVLVILFVSRSSYWAVLVPLGTALTGMFSSGSYEDKIDIMSDTSPYLGLIITFLGLGEVVGPAIATRSVDMLGYGIAVKIEASICGMLIRILIRTFFLKNED